MLNWLRIDLRDASHPIPFDSGSARARRMEARRLLIEEPGLSGRDALSLVQEVRRLELCEAAETLQSLSD